MRNFHIVAYTRRSCVLNFSSCVEGGDRDGEEEARSMERNLASTTSLLPSCCCDDIEPMSCRHLFREIQKTKMDFLSTRFDRGWAERGIEIKASKISSQGSGAEIISSFRVYLSTAHNHRWQSLKQRARDTAAHFCVWFNFTWQGFHCAMRILNYLPISLSSIFGWVETSRAVWQRERADVKWDTA